MLGWGRGGGEGVERKRVEYLEAEVARVRVELGEVRGRLERVVAELEEVKERLRGGGTALEDRVGRLEHAARLMEERLRGGGTVLEDRRPVEEGPVERVAGGDRGVPCPYCGAAVHAYRKGPVDEGGVVFIGCPRCGARGPVAYSVPMAHHRWEAVASRHAVPAVPELCRRRD